MGILHKLLGSECDDCGGTLYADPDHPKMEETDEETTLGIVVCANCGDKEGDDG